MDKSSLRIIFMGTPEFAVGTLQRLVEERYNVVAVVTQPDRPVGRHQDTLQPSAVKVFAQEHHIPVLQPEKMKDTHFLEQLAAYEADLQVVVAFRMLPEVVWAMPRFGTFNVHAALLPQYRGAAPINWAIIHGEKETGVTTFFLDHQIDTGRVILQKPFEIPQDADVEFVYNGLMHLGAEAALETVKLVLDHGENVPALPQSELEKRLRNEQGSDVTLHAAPKIFKETCQIDWNKTAWQTHCFVRGLSPIPGAWSPCVVQDKPQTIKILRTALTHQPVDEKVTVGSLRTEGSRLFVACSDEWLELCVLQLSGKKRMETADLLRGLRSASALRLNVQ